MGQGRRRNRGNKSEGQFQSREENNIWGWVSSHRVKQLLPAVFCALRLRPNIGDGNLVLGLSVGMSRRLKGLFEGGRNFLIETAKWKLLDWFNIM